MPLRTIQESHRPQVSDRTMRCHSSSGQLSGLYVSENEWRCHKRKMEPQGRGNVSPLCTRRRNRKLGLCKTTLRGRVHVQTIGLNAEKIISAPSRWGRFSLDIPSYRTSELLVILPQWATANRERQGALTESRTTIAGDPFYREWLCGAGQGCMVVYWGAFTSITACL